MKPESKFQDDCIRVAVAHERMAMASNYVHRLIIGFQLDENENFRRVTTNM